MECRFVTRSPGNSTSYRLPGAPALGVHRQIIFARPRRIDACQHCLRNAHSLVFINYADCSEMQIAALKNVADGDRAERYKRDPTCSSHPSPGLSSEAFEHEPVDGPDDEHHGDQRGCYVREAEGPRARHVTDPVHCLSHGTHLMRVAVTGPVLLTRVVFRQMRKPARAAFQNARDVFSLLKVSMDRSAGTTSTRPKPTHWR